MGGTLKWGPLWMAMVSIPAFFSVWHSAWGLSAAAYIQASRLTDRQTPMLMKPVVLNVVFILGLVAGPSALISTTVVATTKFNRGYEAFRRLHPLLLAASVALDGHKAAPSAVSRTIPEADDLLNVMFKNLFLFENPFYVCASFSTVGAIVTLIAAVAQARHIHAQLVRLRAAKRAGKRDVEANAQAGGDQSSLVRTFVSVILVSFALAGSAITYTVVCMIGDLVVNATPIFQISKAGTLHMYLYLSGYTTINTVHEGHLWSILSTRVARRCPLAELSIEILDEITLHLPRDALSALALTSKRFYQHFHLRAVAGQLETCALSDRGGFGGQLWLFSDATESSEFGWTPFVLSIEKDCISIGPDGKQKLALQLIGPEFTRFDKAAPTDSYLFVCQTSRSVHVSDAYFETDQIGADVEAGMAVTKDWDEDVAGHLIRATPRLLQQRFKCPECNGQGFVDVGNKEILARWPRLKENWLPDVELPCPRCTESYDEVVDILGECFEAAFEEFQMHQQEMMECMDGGDFDF
ncbi:hypothetical protein RQP46_002069 [Phenoliferia psychrophenolica]